MADEWRPSKLLHYWEQPEYWEESWRLEETCCHSNSSERPSADADMKNSEGVNIDNIDRLYVSRKEGGRGLACIEDRDDASVQGLKNCIKSAKEDSLKWPEHHKQYKDQQNNNKEIEMGRKKCMDILSNRLAKSQTRKPGNS